MSNVKRIQVIPSQIDRPSSQGGVTLTGTYSNLPYNKNAIKRLLALVGDDFEGSLNIFDDGVDLADVFSLKKLQQLLTQVLIRFDNNPNYYTKTDYQYLLWYLCGLLQYFSEGSNPSEDPEDEHKECLSAILPPEGEYKVVNDNTLFIPSFAGDVRTRTLKLHSALNVENKHNIIILK